MQALDPLYCDDPALHRDLPDFFSPQQAYRPSPTDKTNDILYHLYGHNHWDCVPASQIVPFPCPPPSVLSPITLTAYPCDESPNDPAVLPHAAPDSRDDYSHTLASQPPYPHNTVPAPPSPPWNPYDAHERLRHEFLLLPENAHHCVSAPPRVPPPSLAVHIAAAAALSGGAGPGNVHGQMEFQDREMARAYPPLEPNSSRTPAPPPRSPTPPPSAAAENWGASPPMRPLLREPLHHVSVYSTEREDTGTLAWRWQEAQAVWAPQHGWTFSLPDAKPAPPRTWPRPAADTGAASAWPLLPAPLPLPRAEPADRAALRAERGRVGEREREKGADDAPRKPSLACLFCRQRKIACGVPPPGRADRTCYQCARRHRTCEYPKESRRGLRKRKAVAPASVFSPSAAAPSAEGSSSSSAKPRPRPKKAPAPPALPVPGAPPVRGVGAPGRSIHSAEGAAEYAPPPHIVPSQ